MEAPIGGAPLWETLEASFPRGLMPWGLENAIKGRIRKRLRDIAHRVQFPPGEPWERVVETFSIASLERIHRGYGDNPWFWVVCWPQVLGAAAVEYWAEIASAAQRRAVATDAAAAHLEALLMSRALSDCDAIGALPAPAIRGLRAIGQNFLPSLPTVSIPQSAALPPMGEPESGEYWQPPAVPFAPHTQHMSAYALAKYGFTSPDVDEIPQPPPPPGKPPSKHAETPPEPPHKDEAVGHATHMPQNPLGTPTARATRVPPPPVQRAAPLVVPSPSPVCQLPVAPSTRDTALSGADVVCACSRSMVPVDRAAQAYFDCVAVCDVCYEPCGLDSLSGVGMGFLHCAVCSYDVCSVCAPLFSAGGR
mmetsp:Transcript_50525/g.134378  ORF Transcript_50525/g.134378 Transcript_50525/m.134378 type:complete len:364 (-) Transcript_50525:324-1415(-)